MSNDNEFRKLPSVEKVLSDERLIRFHDKYQHDILVNIIRHRIEHFQILIREGSPAPLFNTIIESVLNQLNALDRPSLQPVINATGVILHTNLGRAPLSRETIAAMETVSKGYSNLEFEMDTGTRGSRHVHVESLLCQVTGAESAMVVNNNAAGVLLGLSALAQGKEVIVSRGQAVEIGGSFRVPDVMLQSGARLVEVGTTNCTYINDYDQAVTDQTAGLLRVHSSNFKVVGFTTDVAIEEMAALAKKRNLLLFDDVGSGCLLDTTAFGLAPEPMIQKSIAAGVGLVFFSGDKLLGGPQAGIIAGKKSFIERLKKHPLARAFRVDKTRLAGIAATLTHYLRGEALIKIPVWQMIAMPISDIERRANAWTEALNGQGKVIDGESMVGGGSLPGGTLPTKLVAIGDSAQKEDDTGQKLAVALRRQDIPVIGRISENQLLLDPRTVLPEEDEIVVQTLKTVTVNIN